MINIEQFISTYVTQRDSSLFAKDIQNNHTALTNAIKDKTLLVIGGAGSIGSSFIKACLPFRPKTLVVVDVNENGLAELTRDLRSSKDLFIPDDYIPYPINYAHYVFEKMFRARGGFDIVANFSAHKHVRSEKDIYSIEELLQNNVLNAKKLLDLLAEFPPQAYFCVSTDKAANPVNIMGASKRIMEDVIFSYSDKFPVKTARFANVAFSNGSLPAGFIERISKLQPISAPNDVKRYFVSPVESGQICMLACMLGKNREIYFPKLEEKKMKTFSSIATDFLHENGYEVLECISDQDAIDKAEDLKMGAKKYPVHYSGSDTTGEKGYEEFFTYNEKTDMKQFESLGVVTNRVARPVNEIKDLFSNLENAFSKPNTTKAEVVQILQKFLPNFEHKEKGKNLDEKM